MRTSHKEEGPEKLLEHPSSTGNEKTATSACDEDPSIPWPAHIPERKLLRRIDLHVMPCLCIMYLLAFLDRINIGNASVFGLLEDLDLTGTRFNAALAIFFAPYCLFEIPSNILLKRFKPHIWLSVNMFLFGFVTIMQGLVQNWAGLLTTRFFLGLFETGMFPGCLYLIGMWYTRREAQKRYSLFFCTTSLAGSFGGLLAAAIGKMQGLQGYSGWRWIFVLEGALTVALSFILFFLLPDFPEESKWLSPQERTYIRARLRAEQGASARDRPLTLKDIGRVLKDHEIFVGGFMYFGLIVPAYGFAYFAPGIVQALGDYSAVETQLHTVPPWAAAFVFCMLIATISDHTRHRFGFAVFSICLAITGFAILISVHDMLHVQYGALFLVTMGTYTAMPIVICWFNMNLGGHHKRSVGSAWQIGFGNTGGIIATFAFLSQDAPKFVTGYSICLAFTALGICACITYATSCLIANRKREKVMDGEELIEDGEIDEGNVEARYRYML